METPTWLRVGIVRCGYQGGILAQTIARGKALHVTACTDRNCKDDSGVSEPCRKFPRRQTMTTFVLVHGAWQGASTWDLVVPRLWAAGHQVYMPTLIGLGASAHRLTPQVNLDMHIQDVVGVINYERLQDVILVGHSYAGMIITGVAELVRERLGRLVYVDAFIPDDGQSAMQLFPERFQAAFRDQARSDGDGWRLLGSEKRLDLWGLKEGPARDFVRSKLCDFSINCFEQPLMLPNNAAATLDRTYIACVGEGYPARPVFARFAERAKAEGWGYHELPTGHDCHVEMPEASSELLLGLVGTRKPVMG